MLLEQQDEPEEAERIRHAPGVAKAAAEGQALLRRGDRSIVGALCRRQDGDPQQRPRADGGGRRLPVGQCALQPPPPLGALAMGMPVRSERPGEPERRVRVAALGQPREGRPEVVVLRFQPVQPRWRRHRTHGGNKGLLRQPHTPRGVAAVHLRFFAAGCQVLRRELPDGLQHHEARFTVVLFKPIEQARLHQ